MFAKTRQEQMERAGKRVFTVESEVKIIENEIKKIKGRSKKTKAKKNE